MKKLDVILIKPSKYRIDGFVERFQSGFMPNATLTHIASMTPERIGDFDVDIHFIDEYIRPDAAYLSSLTNVRGVTTLLAIVGVQSHQFHRAIDLAAFARANGIMHVVIGGPHPMTCDTTELHNRGVSFALCEAEIVWNDILRDATHGELLPVYGNHARWSANISDTKFRPPPQDEVNRHWVPMVGLYPVRGCPFACNFCSVIKIAGRRIRHPSVGSTIDALKVIVNAGIRLVVFTSDNFNKFPSAPELLTAMIEEEININFFFQADTQIAAQPDLVELIGRAGGIEMFIGVESFNRTELRSAKKLHNKPDSYREIIRLCTAAGIRSHFSNIIGFPEQDEQGVIEHLQLLIDMEPHLASFYILTPIPGTDQYNDYRKRGLIYERNLDRFDTTTPTFHHSKISPRRLQQLLFDAYETFYKNAMHSTKFESVPSLRNYMAFCRWSASNGIHPMSGGSGRITVDSVGQYSETRFQTFGIRGLLPLPENLALSANDVLVNRSAKLKQQQEL